MNSSSLSSLRTLKNSCLASVSYNSYFSFTPSQNVIKKTDKNINISIHFFFFSQQDHINIYCLIVCRYAITWFSHELRIYRYAFELISTHKWAHSNFISFIFLLHRYFCIFYVANDTLKTYTLSFAFFFLSSFLFLFLIWLFFTSRCILLSLCFASVHNNFYFSLQAAKTAHETAHMVHFESEIIQETPHKKTTEILWTL